MNYQRPIKAAIFDMDGLLIDSEPLWKQAENEVLHEIGVDTDKVSFEETLGLRIDQVVQLHYARSPWTGMKIDRVIEEIIARVTLKIEDQKPLLPGVEHALSLAKELDLKIGLASASPKKLIYQVIELFQLTDYFAAISSAEYLPYSKPHPEVYLITADQLGVSPYCCVAFEDSFNGMIATKAAQMRSIVVPEHTSYHDPRWTLANYKLPSLLDLNTEHLS